MKKNSTILFFLAAAFIVTITQSFTSTTDAKPGLSIVYADSTGFAPYTNGGWSNYMTYLNQSSTDSVELELVLSHSNNINWSSQQQVGSIVNPLFFPKSEQEITYALLFGNTWKLKIKKNGECYFKQVTGPPPTGNPVILPVSVKYKVN